MDGTRAPLEPEADFLRDLWYFAVPGTRLARGRMLAKTMLGEPLLIGRDEAGGVFALRDICPHRGIPLTCGSFDGREVECCYHGWRFDTGGHCTAIPALVPGQAFTPDRIRVCSYPVRDVGCRLGCASELTGDCRTTRSGGAAGCSHVTEMRSS